MEHEEGVGYDNLGARYYDAKTGQFLSEDPMFWNPEKLIQDPQQMNSYAYARNNPINNVDPDGKLSYRSIENNVTTFAEKFVIGAMDSVYNGAMDFNSPISGMNSATNLVQNGPSNAEALVNNISTSAKTFANPATSDYDRTAIGTNAFLNTFSYLE